MNATWLDAFNDAAKESARVAANMRQRQRLTPRQQCLALIAEYGADLVDQPHWALSTLDVWTPPGQVWRATSCHALVVRASDRPAAWRNLLAELREGVQPCGNTECDTCHPERVEPATSTVLA